jgi:hypothetical protein
VKKIDGAAPGAHGFERLCRHAGALTGELHRRGANGTVERRADADRRGLLERTGHLAQLHRDAFAAFMKRRR